MQTDLIKRGEVLKIINEHRGNFNQIEEEIMKLECAYDVEKVIEQLSNAKLGGRCDAGVVAKEIVRKGGKE